MTNARFSIIQSVAVDDKRLSNAQFRTLAALGKYGDKNGWCFPSLTSLGEILGKSKPAVSKDIKKLIELGYVESTSRYRENGSQTSNMYRLIFDTPRYRGVNPPLTPEVNPLTAQVNEKANAFAQSAKNAEAEGSTKQKAIVPSQVVVKQTQKDVESDYAKLSHLEEVFAKERGITSPDWSTSAKERQKRWRNPIKLLLQQCNGDADLLERVIVKAVRDQMADGLSFSAPDGIYKKAQSMIIDELSSNHGQVVENEAGGYHL